MEQIRISNPKDSKKWNALVGNIAIELLDRKNIKDRTREDVLNQAVEILESCGNPMELVNDVTGLVVGYVQSGKTLSFTTLAALASQNGFNIIIVIAGTTTSLVDQTFNRIAEDLQTNIQNEVSWKTYKNPSFKNKEEIKADLEPGLLNNNPVLLITVMKNSTHLKNLIDLFSQNDVKSFNLKALIIDDEADQASLNTKASKKIESEVSTIYNRIRTLKSVLVNHSYVQYTATPQAPLFISILDILSPEFVHILKPGPDYTGGKSFFARNQNSSYPHISEIPDNEVYTKKHTFSKIPKSLVEAVMFYYLTVTIGALTGENAGKHNRTMMVHPSQFQNIHSVYERWLNQLKKRLLEELELKKTDPDRINLENAFRRIYSEIKWDNQFDLNFEKILEYLSYIIKATPIFLSNSSVKNSINFRKYYSMILVGGQVLDRGFTVEGLNVTYMPRGIGIGNADTLQQRCRFFGYKKKYLDFCKIYLPRQSVRAYIDYVTHEEDLRNKLERIKSENKSLKELKRLFILSPDLNITRKNVISDDIQRYRLKGWRSIQYLDPNNSFNNFIINEFIKDQYFENIHVDNSNFTDSQKHEITTLKVVDIINNLLLSLQYIDPSNSLFVNHFISLLSFQLENNPDQLIRIINMSKGNKRLRSIDDKNKIKNILQGANLKTNYPGDRFIYSEDLITIQIHNIIIKESGENFRTLAIHFPDNLGQDIISLDYKHDGATEEI
jgi:hypothetical protein